MIRRASRLTRVLALAATLGMFLGWAEIALPDVHDGHRNAEPEAAGWTQLAHGHPPVSSEDPGHPPQAPHTCHCVHAHAQALPAVADRAPRAVAPHLRVVSTQHALASVPPEPHFRPPVI